MMFLTSDQDFCTDKELEYFLNLLTQYDAKLLLFVTNKSRLIDDYDNGLLKFGIHPNFLTLLCKPRLRAIFASQFNKKKRDYHRFIRRSKHGNSVEAILDHCLQLVPNASLMRSHYWITSSIIFREAVKRKIKVDVSLFIPYEKVIQFQHDTPHGPIIRISYNFEDAYMLKYFPDFNSSKSESYSDIMILNFHPVHVYNNKKINNFFQSLISNNSFKQHLEEIPSLKNQLK